MVRLNLQEGLQGNRSRDQRASHPDLSLSHLKNCPKTNFLTKLPKLASLDEFLLLATWRRMRDWPFPVHNSPCTPSRQVEMLKKLGEIFLNLLTTGKAAARRGHDMMHRSVLIIYDHQFFIAWSPLIMHDMMHRSAVVIYDQQCFIVTITTVMHEQ